MRRTLTTTLLLLAVATVGAVRAYAASPAFRGPRVVDANGKTLGTAMNTLGGGVVVWRRDGPYVVRFSMMPDGAGIESGGAAIYYEAADCTGQPLVSGDGMIRDVQTFPGVVEQMVTSLGYPADPVTFHTIRSTRQGFNVPGGTCTAIGSVSILVGPMVTIDVSGYTPPFRVK